MKLSKISAMAWENMTQRKLRTSLTTLGVVIGITAIIGLASLGEGFRLEIKERMQQGFELDVLTVIPGSLFAGWRSPFTESEVDKVRSVANISVATPVIQIGNVTLFNENNGNVTKAFVATAVNFTEFSQVFPDRFSNFESNISEPKDWGNTSMVIGFKVNHPNVTDTAFAEAGDNVTITTGIGTTFVGNYTLTVAATLIERPTGGITNFDYWVFIPLELGKEIYDFSGAHLIFVKVTNPEYSETVAKQIESLFAEYQISILVPLTFIRQVDRILNIVQLFLMAVASISLLVAGIGIMNIMTVSVMERTREIGILKAIGAKSRTVLAMFLAEAILIGVMGGLIGVFTGYGLSYALAYVLSSFMQPQHGRDTVFQTPETQRMAINPVFSPEWTIIAFIFAIIVCIIFGLYPARKAAKLDPVEALRYE